MTFDLRAHLTKNEGGYTAIPEVENPSPEKAEVARSESEPLRNFNLSRHLESVAAEGRNHRQFSEEDNAKDLADFYKLCEKVRDEVNETDTREKDNENVVGERHKKAIIGFDKEVEFYKNKVADVLRKHNLTQEYYPPWYNELVDAIFCECWGLPGGLCNWLKGATKEFRESSSAKIIGDRLYYLINGKSTLQPVKISSASRGRLRKAMLLLTPEKNPNDKYHEVYLLDKTRVTIFNEGLTKQAQDCIVFRKFIVKELTFEQQAKYHTIPLEVIPMFEAMIKVGFNVAFVGAVRTAKTTFLTTWQKLENPALEGVIIETDPEIPVHELMPGAPITQLLINDGDKGEIIKNVMRSDADYIVVGEARDGSVLNIAVKAANKGTRRVKITYHTTDPLDLFRDIADDIYQDCGGDRDAIAIRVAKSFQYVFQFVQLPDKSKKRLKGIWEMRYLRDDQMVEMHQICRYLYETDSWVFDYACGRDKEIIGEEEDLASFRVFDKTLKDLAMQFPDPEPVMYSRPIQTNRKVGKKNG